MEGTKLNLPNSAFWERVNVLEQMFFIVEHLLCKLVSRFFLSSLPLTYWKSSGPVTSAVSMFSAFFKPFLCYPSYFEKQNGSGLQQAVKL